MRSGKFPIIECRPTPNLLRPKVEPRLWKAGQKAVASAVAQELCFEGQVGPTLHLTGISSSDYTVPLLSGICNHLFLMTF